MGNKTVFEKLSFESQSQRKQEPPSKPTLIIRPPFTILVLKVVLCRTWHKFTGLRHRSSRLALYELKGAISRTLAKENVLATRVFVAVLFQLYCVWVYSVWFCLFCQGI